MIFPKKKKSFSALIYNINYGMKSTLSEYTHSQLNALQNFNYNTTSPELWC